MTTSTSAESRSRKIVPGIYRELPFADYLAIDAVSRTSLLDLKRSPALCRWRRDHPQPETKAMALGTAIHAAILEPDRFESCFSIGPDVRLNTKDGKLAWSDFEALNPGKAHLRAKDGLQLRAIVAAVRGSAAARKLLVGQGDTELTVVWEDATTGVLCKCRIDRCYHAPRGWVVLDLKSTRDATPEAFTNEIAREEYDFQLAFYGDGLRAAMALDEDPTRAIIAYEKQKPEDGEDEELVIPPPLCSVHLLDPQAIAYSREEYVDLLAFWRECDASDTWPDFSSTIHTYRRPNWKKSWKRGVA